MLRKVGHALDGDRFGPLFALLLAVGVLFCTGMVVLLAAWVVLMALNTSVLAWAIFVGAAAVLFGGCYAIDRVRWWWGRA
jgi:hypothetical protein